jgi:hypothetical protein
VDHLRTNGFTVRGEDMADLAPIKTRHGVPRELQSCHTAVIGSYVIEGHVPAASIKKLLKENPQIVGLAVPGMPAGSPGMDAPGQPAERYQVIAFDRSGRTSVYSSH